MYSTELCHILIKYGIRLVEIFSLYMGYVLLRYFHDVLDVLLRYFHNVWNMSCGDMFIMYGICLFEVHS